GGGGGLGGGGAGRGGGGVVGGDGEVRGTVHVAHQVLERVAHPPAVAVDAGHLRVAVQVHVVDAAVRERGREGLQRGRDAHVLEAAVAGEVDPRRGARALARARVVGEHSDQPVEVVVRVAAAHPVIGVREARVEPQARV